MAGAGCGAAAVYPVASIVAMRSSSATGSVRTTLACSVAKFTVAATPSILLSFFSIRAAQEAHVMPPIDSSTVQAGAAGRVPMTGVPVAMTVLLTRVVRSGRMRGGQALLSASS